jgi:putative transport protein
MTDLVTLLVNQPLLLLFLVAALGYPLGRYRVGGTSVGVSAVLFVGLAFGALDPRLELPEFAYVFGLVLFVYAVGLASASGLVASFRRRSMRELALVFGVLIGATMLTAALARALGLSAGMAAGLLAGSLNNTPALAAVLEHLHTPPPGGAAEPIIGYSLTYPLGVLGALAALALGRRVWRVSAADEQDQLEAAGVITPEPVTQAITVTRKSNAPLRLDDLCEQQGWQVIFGRLRRSGETHPVDPHTTVEPGDVFTVVGPPAEIARVVEYLGKPSQERIDWDRTSVDYRRVFVSSAEVAGRTLGELDLPAKFGAVVTRVRRGDVEMLARDDLVLELGDRVRVVTDRSRLDAVSAYFGDSYRDLSEVDIMAFSVGPALGLVLGTIAVPLPGGIDIRLGTAGGPLLAALVLGWLHRTGPIVWVLPYSANLTLRQIGLVLFLAAIGTRAGWEFRSLLATGGGLTIVAAGALVTFTTALSTLWLAHRVLKMPLALASGTVAAVQTQPAVLGFAVEQARNDLPNLTYARAYPLALVAKIVLAQILFELLE